MKYPNTKTMNIVEFSNCKRMLFELSVLVNITLLQKLRLLKDEYMWKINKLNFYYKFENNLLPEYF